MTNFHAQLGERVRTRDALRVASSFFSDGLEKFKAGELELALSLFEQTLAVNQKYLQPEASSMASCFQSNSFRQFKLTTTRLDARCQPS